MFLNFLYSVLIKLAFLGFMFCLILNTSQAQILYSNSGTPLDAYSNLSNGNQISDASLGNRIYYKNPALLDTTSAGDFNLTYLHQISNHSISAGYQLDKNKIFSASVFFNSNSINDFVETDDLGNIIGKYGIGSNQIGFLVSKLQGNFRLGFSNRIVINNLAGLRQFGNFIDFGGQFIHPKKDLKFAFCINNINLILKKNQYYSSFDPLELNVGSSFKPKYMPIRFHIGVGKRINPNNRILPENNKVYDGFWLNKGMFQSDVLIHKNINLIGGFNLFQDFNGSIKNSISYGLVFMKDKYGLSASNRKELGLFNILSFSLYIATK